MNNPVMRCKMRVEEVVHRLDAKGQVESESVKLCAVTDTCPENAQFSRWTPSANFNVYITNPSAFKLLSRGHEFYVDFIPAPLVPENPPV